VIGRHDDDGDRRLPASDNRRRPSARIPVLRSRVDQFPYYKSPRAGWSVFRRTIDARREETKIGNGVKKKLAHKLRVPRIRSIDIFIAFDVSCRVRIDIGIREANNK